MKIRISASRVITESKDFCVDVPDEVGRQLLDDKFAAAGHAWAEIQVSLKQNLQWARGIAGETDIRFTEA